MKNPIPLFLILCSPAIGNGHSEGHELAVWCAANSLPPNAMSRTLAFSLCFIRGLEGEVDRSPKDGRLLIYELKSFIGDPLPEMKGKPQYPCTFSRVRIFRLPYNDLNLLGKKS